MTLSATRNKRTVIPHWLTIILVGVILSWILYIVFIPGFLGEKTNSWVSLGPPPVAIRSIVDASIDEILVETYDGGFYTTNTTFCSEEEDNGVYCEWKPVEGLDDTEIPLFHLDFSTTRGDDCEELQDGESPSNPNGQIIECVYSVMGGAGYWAEGYFALMSYGNILYWHDGGMGAESPLHLLFLLFMPIIYRFPWFLANIISTIILFVLVIRHYIKED